MPTIPLHSTVLFHWSQDLHSTKNVSCSLFHLAGAQSRQTFTESGRKISPFRPTISLEQDLWWMVFYMSANSRGILNIWLIKTGTILLYLNLVYSGYILTPFLSCGCRGFTWMMVMVVRRKQLRHYNFLSLLPTVGLIRWKLILASFL